MILEICIKMDLSFDSTAPQRYIQQMIVCSGKQYSQKSNANEWNVLSKLINLITME